MLLPASGWREAPCRSGNPPSLDGASFTRTTRPTLASNVGCSSFRWASPQRSCSRACVRRRHGEHSSRRSMVGGRRRFASQLPSVAPRGALASCQDSATAPRWFRRAVTPPVWIQSVLGSPLEDQMVTSAGTLGDGAAAEARSKRPARSSYPCAKKNRRERRGKQ